MLSGNIVQTINSFILTTSYLKRVEDVLDAPGEMEGDKMKKTLEGNILLKNVTFSYSKYSENVIHNVTLDIKKGQKVALIGQSGSGKNDTRQHDNRAIRTVFGRHLLRRR